MPLAPLTHRPQTLKQAKKAYRKTGGTVRLSDSEKAVLERRAVLQERADRIKEREARRKANLKRKEERVQREREARHRMGISTPPAKEGIQVGPSQLHLSNFMYSGIKRKRGDGEGEDQIGGIHKEEETVSQDEQMSPMEPPPSRQPLQPLSANASPQRLQNAKVDPPKVRDFAIQEKPASPKVAPIPRKPLSLDLKKGMREDGVPEPFRSLLPKAQTTPEVYKRMGLPTMSPPLRTPPLRPVPAAPTPSTTLQDAPSTPAPPQSVAIPEDSLDDFFVSNTQIQRELSPPPTPPTASRTPNAFSTAQPPTPPPPPQASTPPAADNDPADLLALLSTQDLDFSDKPTPPATPSPRNDSGPDEDFPDNELEDIVLEFELDSPVRSSNATTPPVQPPKPDLASQRDGNRHSNSNYYSSSSSSTSSTSAQPGLQAIHRERKAESQRQEAERAAAEYDAFGLSTQDLMELES